MLEEAAYLEQKVRRCKLTPLVVRKIGQKALGAGSFGAANASCRASPAHPVVEGMRLEASSDLRLGRLLLLKQLCHFLDEAVGIAEDQLVGSVIWDRRAWKNELRPAFLEAAADQVGDELDEAAVAHLRLDNVVVLASTVVLGPERLDHLDVALMKLGVDLVGRREEAVHESLERAEVAQISAALRANPLLARLEPHPLAAAVANQTLVVGGVHRSDLSTGSGDGRRAKA
jgi:hypothetical protein